MKLLNNCNNAVTGFLFHFGALLRWMALTAILMSVFAQERIVITDKSIATDSILIDQSQVDVAKTINDYFELGGMDPDIENLRQIAIKRLAGIGITKSMMTAKFARVTWTSQPSEKPWMRGPGSGSTSPDLRVRC